MDFREALKAHTMWKVRLSDYFTLADNSLDAAEVEIDNRCVLGKWIYGEGIAYSHIPEYEMLKNYHKDFHKIAANLIRRVNNGEVLDKKEVLGLNSEYDTVSMNVSQYILALQRKVQLSDEKAK
jgi:hypothetical protein